VNFRDEFGLSASDKTSIKIDYQFIKDHEGELLLDGYVPQDKNGKVLGKSGVTIASGFDIGQKSPQEIKNIFKNDPTLISTFLPYVGVQKNDAVKLLETKPLSITLQQAQKTDDLIMNYQTTRLENIYGNRTKSDFSSLPANVQTAVADAAFQYGPSSKNLTTVYTQTAQGNYSGAATSLQNLGKAEPAYASRRNDEANLLLAK